MSRPAIRDDIRSCRYRVGGDGTIVATHLVGTMVLSTRQARSTHSTPPSERFDATRSPQLTQHIVRSGLIDETGWARPGSSFARIWPSPGIPGHAEQRPSQFDRPRSLRQNGAGVSRKTGFAPEEDRKRGAPEIRRHLILRIGPGPLVRQRQATAAQRGQKAIQSVHGTHRVRDRPEPPGLESCSRRIFLDSGGSDSVRTERRRATLAHNVTLSRQIAIMRTACQWRVRARIDGARRRHAR